MSAISGSIAPRRPMRADARRNYERLVAAAREVFREHDQDTSLEKIAARAGVGIGTLYRHFPTRLALLEAVYRDEVDDLDTGTEKLLTSTEPWEGLAAWLGLFMTYATTKRALFAELVGAVGKDSELLTHSREVINRTGTAVLSRAQDAGLARADVQVADMVRLVGGCTMMPATSAEQSDRILQVVLAGLRA
ncbi:MAG: TetR/AcrR family transcriptional regulator [Nocardioidaceae bacterium]